MHPGSELRYFPQIYAGISLPTEFFFWPYPKMQKNGLVGHLAKPSVPTHTGYLGVSHIIEDMRQWATQCGSLMRRATARASGPVF
jgi:hypothetical protein